MKKSMIIFRNIGISLTVLLCSTFQQLQAQDSAVAKTKAVAKPIKNTFEGNWIADNQTVMIPVKGTFEADIQHRFGVVTNGYKDLYGLYAPSNIRIGFSYVVKDQLQLGFGFCKDRLQWDINLKYALVKQAVTGGSPVSVTYFGNIAIDTRPKENFVTATDRYSYFNQLIIARKVNKNLSLQVSPSVSYFNNVPAYIDSKGEVLPTMNNAHVAIAFMGRYKISRKSAIFINYDQPLTEHLSNNPNPNIAFGFETTTSSHAFQIFAGNYFGIIPQSNNMFNKNDPSQGQFLIGFNMTRLWNF